MHKRIFVDAFCGKHRNHPITVVISASRFLSGLAINKQNGVKHQQQLSLWHHPE